MADGRPPAADDREQDAAAAASGGAGERAHERPSTEPSAGAPDQHAAPPADGVDGPPDGDEIAHPSLGDMLRQARRDRAISLADAARDTHINHDYLEALESEHYEVLPAPVYARGFLRSYARHLGLDEEAALSLLPADLPRPQGLEPMPGLRRAPRAALPALNGPLALAAAGAVIAAVLLFFVASRLTGDDGDEQAREPPAIVSPTATAPGGATPSGPPAAGATVAPFEIGETPNFIGVDRDTARALITQLGLEVVLIEVVTADTPAGQVFGQAPDPGTAIEAGGVVQLIVSKGPPQ